MAVSAKLRAPKWYGVVVRVLLVTFLLTLLTFAITLLAGIVVLAISGRAHGATPNMTVAYKYVAAPAAVLVAAVVLVATSVVEIRRYRQAKALTAIENATR
jgi:hypothetical protein